MPKDFNIKSSYWSQFFMIYSLIFLQFFFISFSNLFKVPSTAMPLTWRQEYKKPSQTKIFIRHFVVVSSSTRKKDALGMTLVEASALFWEPDKDQITICSESAITKRLEGVKNIINSCSLPLIPFVYIKYAEYNNLYLRGN